MSAARPVPSLADRRTYATALPKRHGRIGKHLTDEDENVAPDPSKTPDSQGSQVLPSSDLANYPYSPGADPTYRAPGWPTRNGGLPTIRGPEAWRRKELGKGDRPHGLGHERRARSLAIGKDVSTQEMLWALSEQSTAPPPLPPPLPSRRPAATTIPSHHPHSRKISVTSPPPATTPLPPAPTLDSIPETPQTAPLHTQTDGFGEQLDPNPPPRRNRSNLNRSRQSLDTSPFASTSDLIPPPIHPYIRKQEPVGTTNVIWAYTRLVALFHPSNAYIPPDPLLPLRSMLLHQPVGSGSLIPTTDVEHAPPSRWQLSFGTGTIGAGTQPSLTGSLFGLAKDLVYGGDGGSLEEERKRVWNMKDLPVLETPRSLLGVDIRLAEGETKECESTHRLSQQI